MHKIKVAIVGVGNCASSLVQGVSYCTDNPEAPGQMYKLIGPYKISDIEFVAAFDIDKRKVGKKLSSAIFSEPNCTTVFSKVNEIEVVVQKGHILDGVASHMTKLIEIDFETPEVDVANILKASGAEICICYLPVGSEKAARFYAQASLDAGVAFINAIPEFICSDESWKGISTQGVLSDMIISTKVSLI